MVSQTYESISEPLPQFALDRVGITSLRAINIDSLRSYHDTKGGETLAMVFVLLDSSHNPLNFRQHASESLASHYVFVVLCFPCSFPGNESSPVSQEILDLCVHH